MELRLIWVLSFVAISVNNALELKGLRFSDNNQTIPWTEENGNASFTFTPFPAQFSFCIKLNLDFVRYITYAGFFYIEDETTGTVLVNTELSNRRGYNFVIEFPGRKGDFEWHFGTERLKANFLRKWTWFCLSLDFKKQTADFAVNGRLLESLHSKKLSKDIPVCKRCRLVLGHFFLDSNPMIGTLLEFSVWNRTLSREEQQTFSDCKTYEKPIGNLLADMSEMDIEGSLIENISIDLEEAQCTEDKQNFILYVPAEFISFINAQNVCHKLKYGIMGKDFQDLDDFMKFNTNANNNNAVRKHSWGGGRIQMWMPYLSRTSKRSAGDFVHYITNNTLPEEVWMKGQPNTKAIKSTTMVYLGKDPAKTRGYNGVKSWYRINADWPASTFCLLPNTEFESIVIVLRGLCKDSMIDTYYQARNDEQGYVTYFGFENTIIFYQPEANGWALKLVNDKMVTGHIRSTVNSLALGNNKWTISNDVKCGEGVVETPLSLTTCMKDEFTCDNGLCIPLLKRCNGEPNCEDASDEVDCKFIERSNSYQQHLSPPPLDDASTLANVNVTVNMKTIQEINELDAIFQVQFWLQMTWLDKRLTFFNLKVDQTSNSLTEAEKGQIWIPIFTFINTEKQDSTVLDEKTKIQIARKGSFILSTLSEVENMQKFSGSNNPLNMTHFYNTRFICDFDMRWYPFDTQRCSIIIRMQGDSWKFVDILKESLKYSGPKDLMLYFIKDQVFETVKVSGVPAIKVEMVLGRRLLSILMTTILPSIVLLLTSHSTNFFKDFFFEAVVTVNLTVMLVLTTMFISVSNNLPTTSYVKMIDIWLLGSLLLPFVEVILHTYMDILRNDYDREINRHGTTKKVGDGDDGSVSSVGGANLVSRNERTEVLAKQAWYERVKATDEKRLLLCKRISKLYVPLFVVVFIIGWWLLGIKNYYFPVFEKSN